MAGLLLDVFVVGSRDGTPVGQMHLAAALANHFRIPVAQVAQAISTRNLRAGQGLSEAQAHALAQQLQSFGAVTEFRPSIATRAATGIASNPVTPTPVTEAAVQRSPTLSGSTAVNTRTTGTHAAVNARGTDTGPLPLPHQITTGNLKLTGELKAFGNPATPVGRDPFAPPEESAPKLELALGRSGVPGSTQTQIEDLGSRPSRSLPGASGLTVARAPADSTESGLDIADDPNKLHNIRCPIHGLYYDKRKASGCRRCLEPAKQVAQAMRRETGEIRLLSMRDNPSKRAFVGLGIALAVGFIPAAYHALKMGPKDVRNLRAEQELLSRKVGTEETLRRFDDLERQVDDARGRAMRNTLIIWVAVAGVIGAGWYKIT